MKKLSCATTENAAPMSLLSLLSLMLSLAYVPTLRAFSDREGQRDTSPTAKGNILSLFCDLGQKPRRFHGFREGHFCPSVRDIVPPLQRKIDHES